MSSDKPRRLRTKEANNELIERIRPLRAKGWSGERIARKIGNVSGDNVRYFCRKYGIKPLSITPLQS